MANIKISDLTAASAAADANEFEINEAGTSKKVTGSQIKAYVNSADGALAQKDTVATADIDDNAVTTAKILDANVTTAKLAADAVDGTKIADDAIGNEHIATDAVNADSIAANSVGADELNVPGNGTAGQYLASDGDGTMTWTTLSIPAGGFSSMQVFTSPGTWTNPGNVTKVKVTVTGCGGGTPNNTPEYGGGGGAGGTAIEIISFPSGTNVPVTVGSAGVGANGGTSSFGAYCSATGGTAASSTSGSKGGVGSGGNLNLRGEAGDNGFNYDASKGGDSYWNAGGMSAKTNGWNPTVGQPGQYGSGAGGSLRTTGASGGTGIVVVEY